MEKYYFKQNGLVCTERCMVKDDVIMIGSSKCRSCENLIDKSKDFDWIKCNKIDLAIGKQTMINKQTTMENTMTHKAPKGCIIKKSKLSEDGKSIVIIYEEVKKLPTELSELDSGGWREVSYADDGMFVISSAKKMNIGEFKGENEYDSKEMAEAFIALRPLVRFRDAWNETEDKEDVQYAIYNYDNKIEIIYQSWDVNFPLSFHTPELRDKFPEQFKDLIIQALPLI